MTGPLFVLPAKAGTYRAHDDEVVPSLAAIAYPAATSAPESCNENGTDSPLVVPHPKNVTPHSRCGAHGGARGGATLAPQQPTTDMGPTHPTSSYRRKNVTPDSPFVVPHPDAVPMVGLGVGQHSLHYNPQPAWDATTPFVLPAKERHPRTPRTSPRTPMRGPYPPSSFVLPANAGIHGVRGRGRVHSTCTTPNRQERHPVHRYGAPPLFHHLVGPEQGHNEP